MNGGDALEETARRRLRTLRPARGWTLDDLAARCHVGASTIAATTGPVAPPARAR